MSNYHHIVIIGGTACGLPYYVSCVIKRESAPVTRGTNYFRDVPDISVRLALS